MQRARCASIHTPTPGRVKPDVLAVGDRVESASVPSESTNPGASCPLFVRSGTSMAAPAIAGALALLRQYFEDGFYSLYNNGSALQQPPSGALLKAVLLSGAVEMEGLSELGLPLEGSPSFRQGWGLANLVQAAPLDTSMGLFVSDNASIATGEVHRYCVDSAAQGGALRATLVWYDAPASPAARRTLINDLDLDVEAPPGGVGASWGAAARPDRVNTVERAEVVWLAVGRYKVTVRGHNVPVLRDGEQGLPYALVVATSPPLDVLEFCDD